MPADTRPTEDTPQDTPHTIPMPCLLSLLLSLPSVLIQCCKFTKPVFLANPPGVFLQPHFPSPDSMHFNHRRHLATFSKVHFLQVIQSGIATKPPNLSSLACLTLAWQQGVGTKYVIIAIFRTSSHCLAPRVGWEESYNWNWDWEVDAELLSTFPVGQWCSWSYFGWWCHAL